MSVQTAPGCLSRRLLDACVPWAELSHGSPVMGLGVLHKTDRSRDEAQTRGKNRAGKRREGEMEERWRRGKEREKRGRRRVSR